MTELTPSISVAVDPANPGQFFACCGLLELADRLWPGAEGWFADGVQEFKIACEGTLRGLLEALVLDPPTAIQRLECNGLEIAPIIAPLAFSFDRGLTTALLLDAWTRIALVKGVAQVVSNTPWNFWSGQQTSMRIWSSLRQELVTQLDQLSDDALTGIFSQRLLQKGRFGFDPGPAWNALDVGFSLNERSVEVESSPATELLAAVGLQRFRPVMNDGRDVFTYCIWHSPFLPSVAAAAMQGAIRDRQSRCFRASVSSRGQYSALAFAYPINVNVGGTDE